GEETSTRWATRRAKTTVAVTTPPTARSRAATTTAGEKGRTVPAPAAGMTRRRGRPRRRTSPAGTRRKRHRTPGQELYPRVRVARASGAGRTRDREPARPRPSRAGPAGGRSAPLAQPVAELLRHGQRLAQCGAARCDRLLEPVEPRGQFGALPLVGRTGFEPVEGVQQVAGLLQAEPQRLHPLDQQQPRHVGLGVEAKTPPGPRGRLDQSHLAVVADRAQRQARAFGHLADLHVVPAHRTTSSPRSPPTVQTTPRRRGRTTPGPGAGPADP